MNRMPLVQDFFDPTGEVYLFPASPAQQRLFFLQQVEPESYTYNMPTAIKLRGMLQPDALRSSLEEIVYRHETLRTTFQLEDGDILQVIHESMRLPFEWIDLQMVPAAEREEQAMALLLQDAQIPFDLIRGPLLRITVLQRGPEEHTLVVNMHHIISDAWSMGLFFDELDWLYAEFSGGEQAELPDLPLQYADYSEWQRQWMQSPAMQTQLSYWKSKLGGTLPVLQLPSDRPHPAVPNSRGALYEFHISQDVMEGIAAIGQREGATLNMTMMALFKALLYRYTGQEDLLLGVPMANRRREVESVIGFFLNTLVFRTPVTGELSFRDLLKRVRQTAVEAYAAQEIPFNTLVEELQPDRQHNHNPLFQVMFVMEHAGEETTRRFGLQSEELVLDLGIAKFDLTLFLTETPNGVRGALEYRTDLFDAPTIARMAEHLLSLLQAVVKEPDQPVHALPMMSQEERHLVMQKWNATEVEYPTAVMIHHLVEQQVEHAPDVTAVTFGNEALTYRELNERANALAHLLRERGVGPDSLVAICMYRSLNMIVSVLAVLKSGGAYVPLDPNYPQERLQYMLETAQAQVVLTQESLLTNFAAQSIASICVDSEVEFSAQTDNLSTLGKLENLGYVIFTSGSTGKPKGVSLPHRALVNLLHWQMARSAHHIGHRTLQYTSLSFDVSFQEIFSTLAAGGTLVVIDEEQRQDFIAMPQLLAEQQIERLFMPFIALKHLTEECVSQEIYPSTLREVITAGEALQVTPSIVQFFQQLEQCVLENQYGPSESHVCSAYRLEGDPTSWDRLPPIGKPIANTQLYVLDAHLQPTPIGVPGELYISGTCLARGYMYRPDLTAERFVQNPFASGVLYKTGDLVRTRADGNIEYLYRIDNQVKIRGFRIELGEVEAVLNQHADVQGSAVIAREINGNKQLIGYVIFRPDTSAKLDEVRTHLQSNLPDYMVPSLLMELEALPLTLSGKVNRLALPTPDASLVNEGEYVPLNTASEEKLAAIWGDVLGLSRVGANDHFFKSGGHSLLATKLISRVQKEFAVKVPLRTIFEAPTVSQLAHFIETLQTGEGSDSEQPLEKIPRDPHAIFRHPASDAQKRLWFVQQVEPESHAYNLPFALRLRGEVNVAALEDAVRSIVQRHESLRTTFELTNGELLQVIHPVLKTRIHVISLTHLPLAEREEAAWHVISSEAQHPFDLETGPLMRVTLVELGDEYMMLLNMHHIVSDGYSMTVFFQELNSFYISETLPALPVQYVDASQWQANRLQREAEHKLLPYWKEQLSGEIQPLQLPTDHPRPAVQSSRGKLRRFPLPDELAQGVQQLSQQAHCTPFMTLMAAFQTLLYRYTGQEDIIVGTPSANRDAQELEGLIGFFVNMLPIRVNLSGDLTFHQLLERVRRVALDAFAHQELPFEKVVEAINPDRHLDHSPLFQVAFLMETYAQQGLLQLPGVEATPLELGTITSKFDLTWVLAETETGSDVLVEYSTDLFEDETIDRMVGHFQTLLAGVIQNPAALLVELPLMPEVERQQLLVQWNDTATEYPRESSIYQLFTEVAARTPDATAVVFKGQALSYRELDERANALAHHLVKRGVGPEQMVGLCLERSVEMIIGILGILKAGGAYVPLDPNYPEDRLQFMLEDTNLQVLLTQAKFAAQLPTAGVQHVIQLDGDQAFLAQESIEPLPNRSQPEHLAYVNYTSGSTGKPKGVCIPHRAVVRLVRETNFLTFSPDDVFLQFSSISFDAATLELWGSLLNGSKLVIFPSFQPTLSDLGRVLREQQVTTLWLTAGLFHQMVDEHLEDLATVRYLLAGGDVLSASHVKRVLAQHPYCTVINGYGPTENTTFTCCYAVTSEQQIGTTVPIGRPIANTVVYVLDARRQPVPVGVAGELYTGGDGLALGYLNRDELTAERFVPHPFSNDPQARLYKTGDRVRYLSDGRIEFIGRIDNQVKIRGFRIELGEVETALLQHDGVVDTVVLARENAAGVKQLVAYVVPTAPEQVSAGALRTFLRERLPEYMVPNLFLLLEQLPLTANGKVNTRALPEPSEMDVAHEASYVAPRTERERQMVHIWEEVLGVHPIGVTDHFFNLGGHSLLAMKLSSLVEQQFGRTLPLVAVFQKGTIAELMEYLQEPDSQTSYTPLVPIQTAGTEKPLFFVHPGGGNVFSYTALAQALGPDQPFYGLQARGLEGDQEPIRDLREMAKVYLVAIRQVQAHGPYRIGGWSLGGVVAYEMAQQLKQQGEEVELLVMLDSFAPEESAREIEVRDLFVDFTSDLLSVAGVELPAGLVPAEFDVESALESLRVYAQYQQVLPEQLGVAHLRRLFQVYAANIQAAYHGYVPQFYAGNVLLLQAAEQSEYGPVATGWRSLVQELRVKEIEGTHYTMMQGMNVQALADQIRESFAKAVQDPASV